MSVRCLPLFLSLMVLGLLASPEEALPYLTKTDAQHYADLGLKKRFGPLYSQAVDSAVRCKRRARARFRCRVGFVIGDLVYVGSEGIWLSWDRGDVIWNYSLDMTRINEYCVSVQGKSVAACSKHIRVR